MPFDASPVDSEVVTVLKKARARLAMPENLALFQVQRVNNAQCTVGALYDADENFIGAAKFFAWANGFEDPAWVMIEHDSIITRKGTGRAHKTIMGWFDRAIILAGGTP